jgi:hypothetical protein
MHLQIKSFLFINLMNLKTLNVVYTYTNIGQMHATM